MALPLIKQRDLRDLADRRAIAAQLKADLEQIQADVTLAELTLMDAVDAGAPCERGPLTPGITSQPGAVRPKWREEGAAANGAAWVDAVIARTPRGAPTRRLIIMEQGKAVTP